MMIAAIAFVQEDAKGGSVISASGLIKAPVLSPAKGYCRRPGATLHNIVSDSVTIKISHNHTGGGKADVK
jgi:hypothetical protein